MSRPVVEVEGTAVPGVATLAAAKAHWLGLISHRPRWGLTARGWLAILAGFIASSFALALGIYPFLAPTERVEAPVLVVEGWVHEYALRAAIAEYYAHSYRQLITTGGPVEGVGTYVNDHSTGASIAAGRLVAAGFPRDRIAMVPARLTARDRTYEAALALDEWLRHQSPEVRAINVVTADVHARRTRLLFQEALGPRIRVGVIAVPSVDYDAAHWWRYSEGVRAVLGESIAYAYARFLFFPSQPASAHSAVTSL